MTTAEHSVVARAMTWLVLALSVLLLALGIAWYGISVETHQRFWSDIFARPSGPMTFRFILQPVMAGIAAVADGVNDARHGHKAFFWTARHDPSVMHGRLREGLSSTARVALIGISMDIFYQFRVFDRFYPVESLMMALLLAVIPYFVFRWIVERIARRRIARIAANARTDGA